MPRLEENILRAISKKTYQPVKPKTLARQLGLPVNLYSEFRRVLKDLQKQGRIEFGRNHTIRQVQPHGTLTGIFRKTAGGYGFVRPHVNEPGAISEIYIPESAVLDASSGDEVLVRMRKKPNRPDISPTGEILQVLGRATRQFVGTYFERDGNGYVRVDGTVFSHSIFVGDPGTKGAQPEDKVVFEMIRFPEADNRRGEGVIVEVLGPHGQPGVDTVSIIREFNLPDRFPEDALEQAREAAISFHENDLDGREDFTGQQTITIDPEEARDFDDAVSLERDRETGHFTLSVHIADVGHFAPAGTALDREARKRATSVYLPQKVIPMFPEVISNNLASLQEGRNRYVKSVQIEFNPEGQVVHTRFANGVICVRKRFAYEQVFAFLDEHDRQSRPGNKSSKKEEKKPKLITEGEVSDNPAADGVEKPTKKRKSKKTTSAVAIEEGIARMILLMRDLAMILRERRMTRGALELDMPEAQLEFDKDGRVTGAHFRKHDISHQIIEEFMLAANEAVATQLDDLDVAFLRRVHPPPLEEKLKAFTEFARILGYKIKSGTNRFALQRLLKQSATQPDRYAVHYAMLRSLKQAIYSPEREEHYALATEQYCHFTSPIRRFPDLVVHRLLGQWLRTGKAGSDPAELVALGDHCSKMERRAALAERELIKVKLLTYMNDRLGLEMEGIITGVADYGFYAQAEQVPVEGLVRIASLEDDYYFYEESSHSLIGKKTKRRYRLGD